MSVISLPFVFYLVYKNCAELLNAGFTNDGVYQILSDQSEVIDIYCDQSSWGGGNRNYTSCDPQMVRAWLRATLTTSKNQKCFTLVFPITFVT